MDLWPILIQFFFNIKTAVLKKKYICEFCRFSRFTQFYDVLFIHTYENNINLFTIEFYQTNIYKFTRPHARNTASSLQRPTN